LRARRGLESLIEWTARTANLSKLVENDEARGETIGGSSLGAESLIASAQFGAEQFLRAFADADGARQFRIKADHLGSQRKDDRGLVAGLCS
jgi:hypothetical protein